MQAPIIVFAFNRLEALRNTIASLLRNSEAIESDLFIFVDGARTNKEGEAEKVSAVQDFVKSITGFRSLHYSFSESNKGLGPSIIAGVSDIINRYGRAIILEDDLVVAPNFLAFMNQGLERYENCPEVFSICGYNNKVRVPYGYNADAYFCVRSSSWGWGTWADRWNSVDWELNDWESVEQRAKAFNRWGGSDCFKMLRDWHNGLNQSWAIRFCYAQFVQRKYTVLPNRSLVKNVGYGGTGTHCPEYCRYKFVYDEGINKNFKFPPVQEPDSRITRQVMHYDSLPVRIKSRLINTFLQYRHKLLCR